MIFPDIFVPSREIILPNRKLILPRCPQFGGMGGLGPIAANRRRSSSTPTTLDDYSNLVEWHLTPISGATNGNATGWPDSKASWNLSSLYEPAPIYSTNSINGYDAVDFTPTQGLNGGSGASTFPYTLIAVVNLTDVSDYRYILGTNFNSGGLSWRVNQTTGFLNMDNDAVAGIGTGNVAVTTGTWHVVAAVATSSTWAFWIDGSTAGSGSHSTPLTGSRSFVLGFSWQGSGLSNTYPWKGKIVEYGIYSVDHTTDIVSMTNGLKTKYGL